MRYFGPYGHAYAIRETLDLLERDGAGRYTLAQPGRDLLAARHASRAAVLGESTSHSNTGLSSKSTPLNRSYSILSQATLPSAYR